MNTSGFFILLMTLAALVACTSQKEVIYETQQLVHDGGKSNQGGTDSGGGNGLSGKPLESYRIDINSQEVFSKVKTIISNVGQNFPELAGDMWHVAQDRRWYNIPSSLDAIPSERIGVAFATDQLALQNLGEIWIDGKLFGAMTTDDRATLLLHEILMGVRLMNFQDDLDKCLASIAFESMSMSSDAQKSKYQADRKNCFLRNGGLGGGGGGGSPLIPDPQSPNINLSKADYENIRSLVIQLNSSNGSVDGFELKQWMKEKGFRNY